MFRSYGALFQIPGTRQFSVTGFFARMPISLYSISVIMLVSIHSGSYGLAGKVSGVATLAAAIFMPQIARMVDRYGQARVARPVIIIGSVGWCMLSLVVTLDWPTWTWYVFAAIGGGAAPSVGAMVRARWVHVVPTKDLQRRAFSWESSLDEIIFIIGPPVATLLTTGVSPASGLLTTAAFLLIGGWLFTAQRSTEPPTGQEAGRLPSRRLIQPSFIAVMAVYFASGLMVGVIDVTVIAFADEQGRKGMAGLILAVWALGSLIAGLVFGVINFRRTVGAQFVIATVLFGVMAALLVLAENLLMLGIIIFLSGFAMAPKVISAYMLVERLVPPSALTEGLTWTITCLVGGVTIGAATAGGIIDAYGARTAFWLSTGCGIAVAVLAIAVRDLFRHAAVMRTSEKMHASLVDPVGTPVPTPELPDEELPRS